MPRFETATAFCVAMMYGWNVIPIPMPVTTRIPATAAGAEPAVSTASSTRPGRVNSDPTIGNTRERPGRGVSWPGTGAGAAPPTGEGVGDTPEPGAGVS